MNGHVSVVNISDLIPVFEPFLQLSDLSDLQGWQLTERLANFVSKGRVHIEQNGCVDHGCEQVFEKQSV